MGINEDEHDDFVARTLLALRGWAGMIGLLEKRPDRVVHPVASDSLLQFVAVRLLLERFALQHIARKELGFREPLALLRKRLEHRVEPPVYKSAEQRAFGVFQIAQLFGWTPERLQALNPQTWRRLVKEIEEFANIDRRRTFQLAYERRFYARVLDALALGAPAPRTDATPRFQAMFCIDEREESFRRHIEETVRESETFGIAGFFFVPMYYRGVADAHFAPQCPPVIRPRHWVIERYVFPDRWRGQVRRLLGLASHQIHVGSRAMAGGAIASTVGVLATIPLIARTLAPRQTARLRAAFSRGLFRPVPTRLHFERHAEAPGENDCGVGFTVDEMADIAERTLRDVGLTSGFARLALMFGHGSTSMNNPHASAYDCGACGGAQGGPNGRAIARILNDRRVRRRLRSRGIDVPEETAFVGAMHNTTNESVTYYDLDELPDSLRPEFEAVRKLIEEACDRDAHERCRRFESAPLTISKSEARRHVEERAADLSQVRAEMGHATNAVCIVGRRERTRGLFFDRRAFLNSYDPTQDDEQGTILTRILQAVVPVCAGINLEYYFSFVDNDGYGSGSKLPHNIAAMLGVMEGAASDLKTGLPWQMVEIHEPVRILFVVETKPETMARILNREPAIGRLVRNEWVRLATLDPDGPELHIHVNGDFHKYRSAGGRLPRAPSSIHWYRGWRDHLEFAEIGANVTGAFQC